MGRPLNPVTSKDWAKRSEPNRFVSPIPHPLEFTQFSGIGLGQYFSHRLIPLGPQLESVLSKEVKSTSQYFPQTLMVQCSQNDPQAPGKLSEIFSAQAKDAAPCLRTFLWGFIPSPPSTSGSDLDTPGMMSTIPSTKKHPCFKISPFQVRFLAYVLPPPLPLPHWEPV